MIYIITILLLTSILAINFKRGVWPFRSIKHKRLFSKPFPKEWIGMIKKNVPIYNRLPQNLKEELHGHVNVMLGEKNFEGCEGLKLTDEIRVTVAAQASILLLNRKTNYYPRLDSILVYPSAYIADDIERMGPIHIEGKSARLGESWKTGLVVLAWDHIKKKASYFETGHNVVFHEFAHQLDQEDGRSDGLPILKEWSSYRAWLRVMKREYEKLQRKVDMGRKDVLDEYGATDPAEFFAVATETFFENPKEMKGKHPELYKEFKEYYNLDPAKWNG